MKIVLADNSITAKVSVAEARALVAGDNCKLSAGRDNFWQINCGDDTELITLNNTSFCVNRAALEGELAGKPSKTGIVCTRENLNLAVQIDIKDYHKNREQK